MKLLHVLCVLCGLLVPASALDREAFTFTKYNLDVRIEPGQQRLAVRGQITLRNDSTAPQKNVSLQISSTLDWRSIKLGGKAVQFIFQPYTSDIDHAGVLSEAIITLPQEIPSKGKLELEIGYEGVIPLDTTRLTRIGVPEELAKHSDWDQIGTSFTAIRGIGYVAWYPVAMQSANLSEGNSLFDMLARWKAREAGSNVQIHFEVVSVTDSPLELVVNADSCKPASTEAGRGQITSVECSFEPLGTTVPAFAVAPYSVLNQSTLDVHYLSESKPAAENYELATELALPFIKEWFGAPRRKVKIVELADPKGSPFESGNMLMTPLNSDSRIAGLATVHQLAHSAFLSPRPWIYEGLAHFAQAAYLEQQSGRQAAVDFMAQHRTALVDAEESLAAERPSSAAAGESLINTSREEFYRSKAMYVWWMLRDMIGEETLKKALALYRPEQDKEPSYMQRLIEAQSKRDLEWFFDDWVYRDRGLPDFRVESAYPRALVGGGYVVTVTVENLGDAGAQVPVTLRMEGGEITRLLEVHAKSKSVLRIGAPGTPQEVVVNDGSVPERDVTNNIFKINPSTK
ncbi:MAG TPA: hypothetical protein VK639_16505 [Terriglobales bacterium]|nr:hypothetical protein [Terriglobales bacterium]